MTELTELTGLRDLAVAPVRGVEDREVADAGEGASTDPHAVVEG